MLPIEEFAKKKSITLNEAWRLVTRGQLKVQEKNGNVYVMDRLLSGGSKVGELAEKFKSKSQMQQEVEDLEILIQTLEKKLKTQAK